MRQETAGQLTAAYTSYENMSMEGIQNVKQKQRPLPVWALINKLNISKI